MKKVVTPFVFVISLMFANMANANVILSLDPDMQDASLGDLVSVNLMIDGLGDGVPLSLAAFDINVAFDDSALSFAGYNMFDHLGVASTDPFDFLADAWDSSFGDLGGGLVNLSEVSYLSNFDLWDFQPGSFAIAELLFTVDVVPSNSLISIDGAVLNDVNGDLINVIGVNDATITAVPTPANALLMCLGLFVLFVRKKFH